MKVTFHAEKNAINQSKHSISLVRAADFDFDAALYAVDDSHNYGEVRINALGFINAALHVLVFSPRGEDSIRAISLRRATKQEHRLYAENE
ncbi:MAG: BrnT family toxin [Bryocella sp.]